MGFTKLEKARINVLKGDIPTEAKGKIAIHCSNCNVQSTISKAEEDEWWIDDMEGYPGRSYKQLWDLCQQCRSHTKKETEIEIDLCCPDPETETVTETGTGTKTKVVKTDVTCERCHSRCKYGEGKWCCNGNALYCYTCDGPFCLDCHDKIHYNK